MKSVIQRQKASVRQEERIARDMGGRRVAGSGNQSHSKGDVRTSEWLVEAKRTQSVRFPLTLALWRKIETEAIKEHKLPMMVIEMAGRSLVVLDFNTFQAISQR